MPKAIYLLPSKSAQLCDALAAPTNCLFIISCHPPIFSGIPYLKRTKSPSTHWFSAPELEACLLKPGANCIFLNGIWVLYTRYSNL